MYNFSFLRTLETRNRQSNSRQSEGKVKVGLSVFTFTLLQSAPARKTKEEAYHEGKLGDTKQTMYVVSLSAF